MASMLKDFKCDYHRNGICGIGFWNCYFTHEKIPMRAVVFLNDDSKAEYYAVTSDEVHQRWRGDHFIDDLIYSIKETQKKVLANTEA